jgi:large subunit ribosomal protein L10
MNREQKAVLVASLKDEFAQSKAAFLVNYSGLTVEQLQNLRKGLRSKGGRMKITKARLMKMAAQDIPEAQIMEPFFKEQIGVVFARQEAPSVAKILTDFAKEHEAMSIVVGSLEHRLLDKADITRIASLPSKEVLLAQLCGTLQAPVARLAIALKMIQLKFLWTLKQIGDKKS